ncbi:MAG: transcription termination factor NusA [Puniceicoccales bacterium]|jgi:N utilization substance protein A|nr:transcription termination factor NusA [Puniceicoccales bacterium]
MKTGSEILAVLEYMEKEKGIPRTLLIQTIADAIRSAALKSINAGYDVRVDINPKTGHLQAWSVLEVVDSISDPSAQIHVSKAKYINPTANVGDVIEKEIDPAFLGRIAAQSARQAITQGIRHFEREKLYDDFKNSVGDVISGIVRRQDNGNIYIELGKSEATLPNKERIPGEEYMPGDRVCCLLLRIDHNPYGPEIILSRSHPKFVRRLLELEVTEIADNTVEIYNMAREPGYRTKIAVHSTDPKVDAVGSCVGARGVRIRSIVKELGGEKIDIIRYFEDPIEFLQEAIHPAIARNICVDADNRQISFEVGEEDLAVAIGKRGLNARLTSRLMNWKLDIKKAESEKEKKLNKKIQQATAGLNNIPGIDGDLAQRLVACGFTDLEVFDDVAPEDLQDAGFSSEEAQFILENIKNFRDSQ